MDKSEVTFTQANKALLDIEDVVKKHLIANMDGKVYFCSIITALINQYIDIECGITKQTRKEIFDQFFLRTEFVLIHKKMGDRDCKE